LDPASQEGIDGHELLDVRPHHALDEESIGAVGKLEHLDDAQHRAGAVHVVRAGAALHRVSDRAAQHQPLGGEEHGVDQALGALRVHQQRIEEVGKQHGVLEREHRQDLGELDAGGLLVLRLHPRVDGDLRPSRRQGRALLEESRGTKAPGPVAHDCTSMERAARLGSVTLR
jgi:hypothetical protein